MRIVTVILFLTITHSVFGQKIDTVKSLLNERHYGKLVSYLSNIKSTEIFDIYSEEINRQIVNEFSEIEIYFPESFTIKGKSDEYRLYRYFINLLTFGDSIIYCKVINDNSRRPKTEMVFIDDTSIKELQKQFSATYNKLVGVNDFFTSKGVTYGNACECGGETLILRKKLDELIAKQNVSEIDNLLCSPIAEIQVYGVDALWQLKTKGYKLTPNELNLVKTIKNKKGKIRKCSGCYRETGTIYDMTKEFQF